MKKYDYIIVGGGLFGGVFAREALNRNKKCLIIEKRPQLGGNLFCREINGINVHVYGAHIFHTHDKWVWNYFNKYAECNSFINSPLANYKGEIYNLPFNMNTFRAMWGVNTPDEAKKIIAEQRKAVGKNPSNLEEQAIHLVGTDVYEKLVKGYTEKQWGLPCTELPAFIIKRLPVRFTYNNNYFNDRWQGIPKGGYNVLINNLFDGADIMLNTDYNSDREKFNSLGEKIVYTGTLDSFYDYKFGKLEYRSLKFETEFLPDTDNFQGVAVMNYTDSETPFTRIIEHKHFEHGTQHGTVITREYPQNHGDNSEAYYPVNNDKNQTLYAKYAELAVKEKNIIFGGRLAEYRYYDMDEIIKSALELVENELD